ncbi:MAG TPA: hypothetical protein VGK79_11370 [Gaiellaceae bacterium]
MRALSVVLVALAAVIFAAPSSASGWLPHPADATWTYQWTDSVYDTTPTNEIVTVKSQAGSSFTLAWTTKDAGTPDAPQSEGTVSFQDTNFGVVNTDWTSTPPPSAFPILCASLAQCGNSLASTYYNVIWGARAPVLFEPVLQGTSWNATGAAQNDVTAANDYLGTETVTVPAFDKPVIAAKIRSQITQAGALGDPYGSGVRTTWWVYGVGPVKVVFQHAGGSGAAVTTAVLQSTNQTAQSPPSDAAYFPMQARLKGTYRWTNERYFKKPEVESFTVDQAANDTAIVKVQSVSGPMKVAGAYQFTTRIDGVTSVASATKAASLAKLPPLGPRALPPAKRRHFFTPFDLMTFGFNPVMPAYPTAGATWSADPSGRDFAVYGVTGSSRVVGIQKVTVPAGTFDALVIASSLRQAGFPFGSGTRTMWFAAGKGLVKLLFRHGDRSVSVVELLK